MSSQPKPRFVRSANDGQLGRLEEHDGKLMVRLDRPGENIWQVYSANNWLEEPEERPLGVAQVARIAYFADRELRLAQGEFASSVKDWLSLQEDARAKWIASGPPKSSELRRMLYCAIREVLG